MNLKKSLPYPYLLIFIFYAFAVSPLEAQISTDGTLGPAKALSGPDYGIDAELGKQVGGNLFHSFDTFNINTGESATFRGPDSVRNIVSRVTGGDASLIDGRLGSEIPDADIYFLNPNGIFFGQNAVLDVGGSFHVSTADFLRLKEDGRFDVRQPENSVLSSASPSAFGFLDESPKGITSEGNLMLPGGKTLSVVGGDIDIRGGVLATQGGDIHLVGTAGPGEVTSGDSADVSPDAYGGRISFSGGAAADVSGNTSGEIRIRGGRFETVGEGSSLLSFTGNADGGAIDIRVKNELTVAEGGMIATATFPEGMGKSGDIRVSAASLNISDDGTLTTISAGGGDSGNIEIHAGHLEMRNGGIADTGVLGTGSGGHISIDADSVEISGKGTYRSGLYAETGGSGDARGISVSAETITLSEEGTMSAATVGQGQAGDISLDTGTLDIGGGGSIDSSTQGEGDAGNILVKAEDTLAISQEGKFSAMSKGNGDSGNIEIHAGHLEMRNGGIADTRVMGAGSGGDVSIDADSVEISGKGTDKSGLHTGTGGTGNSGNISVSAETITLSEEGTMFAVTVGQGQAGDISLDAGTLEISGGGSIDSSTQGEGDAGNISVTARDAVNISQAGVLTADSRSENGGRGGDVSVRTGFLHVHDEGMIRNATLGKGRGGDVSLDADRVDIVRGCVASVTEGKGESAGQGGDVSIRAEESVNISGSGKDDKSMCGDYYGVYAQSKGSGDGGRVFIRADVLNVDKDGMINGQAYGGRGGDIELRVNRLEIHEGGTVTTSTRGAGPSGNILIDAEESVSLSGKGAKYENSWIYTATHSGGHGGDMDISAPLLDVGGQGMIYAKTLGNDTRDGNTLPDGDAGNIRLNAERLEMDGGTISSGTQCAGEGADIEVNAGVLDMRGNASISAESTGSGDAGNIRIFQADVVEMKDSSITSDADNAGGGKIGVDANTRLSLRNSQITSSVRDGAGNGGDVRVGTEDGPDGPGFVVLNHSRIKANADAGDGGAIFITADSYLQSSDSAVEAKSRRGNQGSVRIESPDVDIAGGLMPMPDNYPDAARWMSRPCSQRVGEKQGRLIIGGKDAIPSALDDWLPSPLPW